MTEDEHKKLTCHRTLGGIASADGSAPWFHPQACIGSQCSAWRWTTKPIPSMQIDGEGFCGLAGEPTE